MKYPTAEVQVILYFYLKFIQFLHTVNNIGIPVIPFINFGSSGGSLRFVDDGAARVDLPAPLRFGSAAFTTAFVSVTFSFLKLQLLSKCMLLIMCVHLQISSNGLISFGVQFTAFRPQTFPISVNVVAPYWDDINLNLKGVVRYAVVDDSHPTLSCLLELTNDLIREEENVEFEASWLLVARWIDVCPFGDSNCVEVYIANYTVFVIVIYAIISQENNFQVIVATDGDQSYAVFTYQCGELNWIRGLSASIGFSAGPSLFANHPLSRQPNVNDIACVNQTCPPWTNVVYRISSDLSCKFKSMNSILVLANSNTIIVIMNRYFVFNVFKIMLIAISCSYCIKCNHLSLFLAIVIPTSSFTPTSSVTATASVTPSVEPPTLPSLTLPSPSPSPTPTNG